MIHFYRVLRTGGLAVLAIGLLSNVALASTQVRGKITKNSSSVLTIGYNATYYYNDDTNCSEVGKGARACDNIRAGAVVTISAEEDEYSLMVAKQVVVVDASGEEPLD